MVKVVLAANVVMALVTVKEWLLMSRLKGEEPLPMG